MNKLLILAAVVMLTACGKRVEEHPLTNDQIIAETKRCEAAGLDAASLRSGGFDNRTYRVECSPRKTDTRVYK
jgi:uncharacterized lipoprotein YajG